MRGVFVGGSGRKKLGLAKANRIFLGLIEPD